MEDFSSAILNELEKLIETDEIKTLIRRTDGTTDNAVKLVHIPSGLEVECEEYQSQVKNKALCLVRLAQRLKK